MMFGPVTASLMKSSAGTVWSVPVPRFSGGVMVASTRPVRHIQPRDDPARGRSHGAWGSAASYLPATLSTASATASTATATATAGGAVARHVPHVERSDRHTVGLAHADVPDRRLVYTEPANAYRARINKALHDCCVAIRRSAPGRRPSTAGVMAHEQRACCSPFRSMAAARCVAARRRARPFPGADPMLDARRSNTTPRPVGGRL